MRLTQKSTERRTKTENRHINQVMKDNQYFIYLELIKEGMHQIFNSSTATEARSKFDEMGEWIEQAKVFYELKRWWKNFNDGWDTFKNYFKHKTGVNLELLTRRATLI